MLILDKTRINILVDVNFLIPTFQVVLIHINKVGNRINKVGHETTKWVNESTKWVNESTSWTAPNQPRGSRQLYDSHSLMFLPNQTKLAFSCNVVTFICQSWSLTRVLKVVVASVFAVELMCGFCLDISFLCGNLKSVPKSSESFLIYKYCDDRAVDWVEALS